MFRKLPVWLSDQYGNEYQVSLDTRNHPFIQIHSDDRDLLSMKDVIDKPLGHEIFWGKWNFTVTKNIYHFGIGDN